MLAESVGSTGNSAPGGVEDYILIRDEKAAGVDGGSALALTRQTRDLNVIVEDDGGHASLGSNQITLAAGTYRVRAHAPAYKVGSHRAILVNISDAVDIIVGSSETTYETNIVQTRSFIEGRFTFASSKILELQHICLRVKTVDGLGFTNDAFFAIIEVYAVIEFWKEA